jgi:diaminopimelate decarboxylase
MTKSPEAWRQRSGEARIWLQHLGSLLKQGYFSDDHPWVLCYDLNKLLSRVAHLRATFPEDTLHTSAIKANPLPPILRLLVDNGMGLEAASIGEIELARHAGCPLDQVVFDSPAKTKSELRRAVESGIAINSNSALELERLSTLQPRGRVGLRCNPMVAGSERATDTMVATRGSKFGVSLDEAQLLLRRYPFVNGLHVHIGSQVATLEDLVEGVGRVSVLAQKSSQISWLDIGGGLPTRYAESDAGLPIVGYLEELRRAVPRLEHYTLVTEIGRALHANCAWAASVVEYVAEGRAILHFGADFCLRECYRASEWWHDFTVLTPVGEPKQAEVVPYDLYGPLCFSGDRMAKGRPLPRLEVGDIVVMHDVGAYTLSMWSRYCSRLMPEIVGFENGEMRVLRKRESASEVVKFWTGIV